MSATIFKVHISEFAVVFKIGVIDSVIADPLKNHVQVEVFYLWF